VPLVPPGSTPGVARFFSQSANSDYLKGITVIPGGGAWAVGTNIRSAAGSNGLIERRSGRSWRVVASPDLGPSATASALYGVAAVSATSSWAVGAATDDGVVTQTLIERWNGASWRRVFSPNPGGAPGVSSLAGVAGYSRSSAWAVGSYITSNIIEPMFYQTLIEHWNGKAWRQTASPSPGHADSFLLGVAVSSRSSAWAVGAYEDDNGYAQTLIEQWNGTSWTQVPSPNPGGPLRSNVLYGVSAISPSNAFAVGTYVNGRVDETLIEHWNGVRWTRVSSPNGPNRPAGSFLYSVAAVSASSAWAVGTWFGAGLDHALIERWNGRVWKRVPSPNPGGPSDTNLLSAVAARSSRSAWAAGFSEKAGSPERTLTEIWNGTAWRAAASPN